MNRLFYVASTDDEENFDLMVVATEPDEVIEAWIKYYGFDDPGTVMGDVPDYTVFQVELDMNKPGPIPWHSARGFHVVETPKMDAYFAMGGKP